MEYPLFQPWPKLGEDPTFWTRFNFSTMRIIKQVFFFIIAVQKYEIFESSEFGKGNFKL